MHSVTEIEEKIRRRYHQPKGVEQFGIEPVPTELKTVRWLDIFSIIFGFALNPGSILVGGLAVVSGLSFFGAVGAITGGVLLATIAYTIMATVGVDFGLPGQVSTRMAYGIRGAKWVPSFLRTIASTYWFAYQTVAGSLAVVAILDRWTGTRHSLVAVSITFAALQAVVAIIGYNSLKHLSRLALPFKIVILSLVLLLLATHERSAFRPVAGVALRREAASRLAPVRDLAQCYCCGLIDDGHRFGRFLPLHSLAHETCGGALCSARSVADALPHCSAPTRRRRLWAPTPMRSPLYRASASAISPCCCF